MTPNDDIECDAEYEARLRRRLAILQQQIKEGKVKFNPGMQSAESLKAIRTGPYGEIDLSTVDSLARALALGVENP